MVGDLAWAGHSAKLAENQGFHPGAREARMRARVPLLPAQPSLACYPGFTQLALPAVGPPVLRGQPSSLPRPRRSGETREPRLRVPAAATRLLSDERRLARTRPGPTR